MSDEKRLPCPLREALKDGGLSERSIELIIHNDELALVIASIAEGECEKFIDFMDSWFKTKRKRKEKTEADKN